MIEQYAVHTAYAIQNASRLHWPYAHILPTGILAPELFDAVRASRMDRSDLEEHVHGESDAKGEGFRRHLSYSWPDVEEGRIRVPEIETVYRVLNHLLVKQALISVFAQDLAKNFGTTRLPLSTSLTYVEDETGYELMPHTDAARKAVTLLIYLAEENDNPNLGTEMYLPRAADYPVDMGPRVVRHRRENFLRAHRVPFRPNRGLGFAPAGNTFHGVGEVSEGNKVRRLLQFQLICNEPRAAAKGA